MAIADSILIKKLTEANALAPKRLEQLLAEAQRRGQALEDYLYFTRAVDPEILLKIKSEIIGLPFRTFEAREEIPKEILSLIPEDSSKNYKIIAFDRKGSQIMVGLVSPEDPRLGEVMKFLSQKLGMEIKQYLISPADFARLLNQYRDFTQEIEDSIKAFRVTKPQETSQVARLEETQAVTSEEAPIIRLVSVLLTRSVQSNASDIHIEPMLNRMRIRFRLEGELKTIAYLPLDILAPIVSRIKILSNLKIDETRIPQDGRFRALVDNREIDFRVSTFPTAKGEKIAIRVLDPSTGLKELGELGIYPYHEKQIKKALEAPYGMILISGPTGSGKTTTLYSLLRTINKDNVNILSLEDPVEYNLDGVNQSQVRPEINYTFASGLRQAVRQDPDIILIGEIRDSETAELAIHSALTGHLVFSTIHTNNVIGIIPRLLDMNIANYLLPASLILMEAQRLVRKLCNFCQKPKTIEPELEKIIDDSLKTLPPELIKTYNIAKPYKFYSSPGCERCNWRGSLGRIGVFETLSMTKQLEDIITRGVTEDDLIKEAQRQQMITMRQDGIIKALAGLVSIEEVLKETT